VRELATRALAQKEQVLLGETRPYGNPYELRMPPPEKRRAAAFDATHSTAFLLYDTHREHMNDQYIFHSVKLVGDTIFVYNLQHDAEGEVSARHCTGCWHGRFAVCGRAPKLPWPTVQFTAPCGRISTTDRPAHPCCAASSLQVWCCRGVARQPARGGLTDAAGLPCRRHAACGHGVALLPATFRVQPVSHAQ
jgi:hypothetical protein